MVRTGASKTLRWGFDSLQLHFFKINSEKVIIMKGLSTLQISTKDTEITFYHLQTYYCNFHTHPWVILCKGKHYYVNDIIAPNHKGIKTRYHIDNERTPVSFRTHGSLFLVKYESGTIHAVIGGNENDYVVDL